MKIEIITPIAREEALGSTRQIYQGYASPGTEINVEQLERGPASVECEFDSALAVPNVLELAKRAENRGYQAIVIDCMGDVGLHAVRELVDIPVVGAAQASMALAATLADRFSVIGVLERDKAFFHNIWRIYDLTGRGASIRSINIPVISLHEDDAELIEAITQQASLAVTEDGAHALVLGCTGMGGKFARTVQQKLEEDGITGVPVIDPTGVALKTAENLVSLGLCHSKRTFPTPPSKKLKGYESLQVA